MLDELLLYQRADYPHDTWWKRAVCEFSDGTEQELSLGQTGAAQRIDVGGKRISWLLLRDLECANPNGFAGLTQIMAMGRPA